MRIKRMRRRSGLLRNRKRRRGRTARARGRCLEWNGSGRARWREAGAECAREEDYDAGNIWTTNDGAVRGGGADGFSFGFGVGVDAEEWCGARGCVGRGDDDGAGCGGRSEEHTSELQA